jgi:hypothetical protein
LKLKHTTKKPEGLADYKEDTPKVIDGVLQRTYTKTPWELEKAREVLLGRVTAKRWEVEVGGMKLPNGTELHTRVDDQNRITSVIANARLAGVREVDFKAKSGWVTLTLQELEQIAAAIALHVQGCFTSERRHQEYIVQIPTLEELENYNINQWWPTYE